MAYLKTQIGRKKRTEAIVLGNALAQVTHLAIGNGGLEVDGVTPKNISGTATALFNEIKRKTVTSVKINDYTYEIYAEFDVTTTDPELIGDTINEVGLVDADGDFIYLETFKLFASSLPSNFKNKHVIVLQMV
jgi:phage-related tail fiber protein